MPFPRRHRHDGLNTHLKRQSSKEDNIIKRAFAALKSMFRSKEKTRVREDYGLPQEVKDFREHIAAEEAEYVLRIRKGEETKEKEMEREIEGKNRAAAEPVHSLRSSQGEHAEALRTGVLKHHDGSMSGRILTKDVYMTDEAGQSSPLVWYKSFSKAATTANASMGAG
ncbi:hypothetical protein MMC28_000322 [Mycoblastus sanguinarius]|nr:hypothetical protein [Mycoblastus sanguinarius]